MSVFTIWALIDAHSDLEQILVVKTPTGVRTDAKFLSLDDLSKYDLHRQ